jgi:hypothetical protein
MQRLLDLFISINCSACFRRFLRPSSGAQNCTYSVRYCQTILLPAAIVDEMELRSISSTIAAILVWQYLALYVQFCAPDDGRRNRLKHAEQFIEINRSRRRCILLVVLYRDILAMHGHMNVKQVPLYVCLFVCLRCGARGLVMVRSLRKALPRVRTGFIVLHVNSKV